MILRAHDLCYAYRDGPPVLRHVHLQLRPGIVSGLFGPNGSGKSTLLRCLNGALMPRSGAVLLDDQPLAAMSRRLIARHIAVVPQNSPLDIPLTVDEFVMLGRFAHQRLLEAPGPQDAQVVRRCLDRLAISHLARRPFADLSGGERQRAVIARALAQEAPILLLDEPNAHLDLAHQLEVYRLARALARQGACVLMICHDLLVAPLMVDHALLLHQGALLADGSPREILNPAALENVFQTRAAICWPGDQKVTADFG